MGAALMILDVRRIGGDGSIRRVRLDTAGRDDAGRWERLVDLACLQVPPPYHPEPGEPVYEVCVAGLAAHIAVGDLQGPVGEVVTAVLAEGRNLA